MQFMTVVLCVAGALGYLALLAVVVRLAFHFQGKIFFGRVAARLYLDVSYTA